MIFPFSVVTVTTRPIASYLALAANEENVNSSEMGIATDQRQQRNSFTPPISIRAEATEARNPSQKLRYLRSPEANSSPSGNHEIQAS